ncbi:MAG: inorganic phosphate transporter [Cellulomonadaceae bacterium]
MAETWILVLVVITALAFDFTNGFHDTGNAMATSIATRALRPKTAVALSAVLNLVGAFLSVAVATTVAKGIVDLDAVAGQALLTVVFAGLVGGILWNVLTWLLGLPSSSSHALFGGLIGGAIASLGVHGVVWSGVLAKIVVPALLAPVVAGLVAAVGTRAVYRITRAVPPAAQERGFRWGQVGSASLVSLAHGTNDAQKTMGVIFLALVAHGSITTDAAMPFWVKASCAVAIAAGTWLGGWRVIRTLGKGLVEIGSPQGMAAETSSAAIILTSSGLGLPLSTTHVATGSILGSGVGRSGAQVRWSLAGRMGLAWLTTIPAAGLMGAACWALAHAVGGALGITVVFGVLVTSCLAMWLAARRAPVNPDNVNDEWQEDAAPAPVPAADAVPATAGRVC